MLNILIVDMPSLSTYLDFNNAKFQTYLYTICYATQLKVNCNSVYSFGHIQTDHSSCIQRNCQGNEIQEELPSLN